MTPPGRRMSRRAQRREPEMLAERAALVVGPEDAAFLQQRHDLVRELIRGRPG